VTRESAAADRFRGTEERFLADVVALVERCRRGDDLAWEALVRSCQSRVYSVALHYLRDREEAKDIAQDVFVRVYRNLDSFENREENFLPWLLSLTRNACIDRLRRMKVRPAVPAVPVDEGPEIADDRPTPEQAAIAAREGRLVRRAIAELNDDHREMIVLHEIQGLELRQISEMLALPIGTVKSRSMRARLALARTVLALDPSYGA
jgi:RNA polymerase sigma-70 factor (ECF subfamily)